MYYGFTNEFHNGKLLRRDFKLSCKINIDKYSFAKKPVAITADETYSAALAKKLFESESKTRSETISSLQQKLSNESDLRAAADAKCEEKISEETALRENAYNLLSANFNRLLESESQSRQTADEILKTGKVDKEIGKGLSEIKSADLNGSSASGDNFYYLKLNKQDGDFDVVRFYDYNQANDKLDKKSDKAATSLKSSGGDISFVLHDEANRNTSYLSSNEDITSISFELGSGEFDYDYTSSLSFKTAQTPPQISYTGSKALIWVGSECTVSGDNSIFAPIANKVYDIVFYFNGLNFVGLVNGYALAEG